MLRGLIEKYSIYDLRLRTIESKIQFLGVVIAGY
jgi:hypothetical protein